MVPGCFSENQVDARNGGQARVPIAMGSWICKKVFQFGIGNREIKIVSERLKYAAGREDFDDRFVPQVLVPRQRTCAPFNHNTTFKITVLLLMLQIVKEPRLVTPRSER